MKNDSWINPLADLGYNAQLIEQTIRIDKTGEAIKPDVVVTSQKMLHCIVFECKGGTTIDTGQILRYKNLKTTDLIRWITIHTDDNFSFDVCVFNFKQNQELIENEIDFPILSLAKTLLEKNNDFSKKEVNKKFENPIPIKDFKPPISYYPFSESEDRRVIIPHILRVIISMLQDKKMNMVDVTNPESFSDEKVLKRIHKMWELLSREHQNTLTKLIKEIIKELKSTYPEFEKQIQSIQNNTKSNTQALSNLSKTCQKILDKENKKTPLDEYF